MATDLYPPPSQYDPIDPPPRRIFDPPESSVVRAISRHRLLIAFCAILLAVIGIAAGFARKPVYTSSATLQVGQVNPNSPGFLGYVQSASALAAAFSRSIAAEPVLEQVEKETGIAPQAALPRLSAEPIPLSPSFRVIATGKSEAGSQELANATAAAVVKYESKSNSSNPQAKSLLGEYQEAAFDLKKAEAKSGKLSNEPKGSPKLLKAESARIAAKVRLTAIESAYVAAVGSQAPRQGLVTLLAGATESTSDKNKKIELYGFVGLIAGIVLGCLLAVLVDRRRRSRTPAEGPAPREA